MIEVARVKVPKADFQAANMIDLRLDDKFDVIICLFGSIGYVQVFSSLVRTFEGFFSHVNDKGLVVVEPWVFKSDFKKGKMSLDTYEDEEAKFVRMATSKIARSVWIISMHYLVGEKGKISYFREVHKMLALNHADYVKAFKEAGFKDIQYLTEGLWESCRGLFVTIK